MAFVDYYGVLDIARNATDTDINNAFLKLAESAPPQEIFTQAQEAREILTNAQARKNYDHTYGFILIIQAQAGSEKKHAQNYVLNKSPRPHLSLLALKDDFQNWVSKKIGLDWSEAQQIHYSSDITSDLNMPYITLRFPDEKILNLYVRKLLDERKIKK